MLDRTKGAVPLYSQLETLLKERIETGEYVTGDVFPSEKQLQEEYEVSRVTVRQAINNLTIAGYLECSRGIGTIVTMDKINENIKRVISFSEEMQQHGITMKTGHCVISKEPASKSVSHNMELPIGTPCYKLVRVRCAQDLPVVYSITYLSPDFNLPMDSDYYKDSLYALLREKHDTQIVRGKDTFEAVIANSEAARFLGLEVGAPVFKRTRKTYNQYDKIIEFTICYYPGERYKYSVDL